MSQGFPTWLVFLVPVKCQVEGDKEEASYFKIEQEKAQPPGLQSLAWTSFLLTEKLFFVVFFYIEANPNKPIELLLYWFSQSSILLIYSGMQLLFCINIYMRYLPRNRNQSNTDLIGCQGTVVQPHWQLRFFQGGLEYILSNICIYLFLQEKKRVTCCVLSFVWICGKI